MDKILEELEQLKKLMLENNLLQKEVLNFNDAVKYLDISASHLYKLTSTNRIPHYCPEGKRLYFSRVELEAWLKRNPRIDHGAIDLAATQYVSKKGKHR